MMWIAFFAGTMVGALLGVVALSIVSMAKDPDEVRRNGEELEALREWRHRHE